MISSIAIAVFARTPVPGTVKTRLIPRLGAQGAARLQTQLIDLALARTLAVAPLGTCLWLAGEPAGHPTPIGVPVHAQRGDDLGARMANAFEMLLPKHETVLLIGTDCPAQSAGDLHQAALALRSHDVVLQPAEDGGYVLIGLSQRVLQHTPPRWRELFADIAWGTEAVLVQTQARLGTTGLRHALLDALPDLDLPQDYVRAVHEGWIAALDVTDDATDGATEGVADRARTG